MDSISECPHDHNEHPYKQTCMTSWLRNCFRFFRKFVRLWTHHQVSLRAAALTYTLILALIPLLVVCLSGGTLFFDVRDLNTRFVNFMMLHLAPGSAAKVSGMITKTIAKIHFKTLGYVSFGALLFTCLLLLASIESSINRIWSIRKKKALWKRVIIYNLLLILGPATISFSLSTITFVSRYFPHYSAKANVIALLVNSVFITFVYKIFPNKRAHWTAVIPAGILVAAVMEVAKWAYALHVKKALFYNDIYGGLAIVPLFLIWIFVNWNIFLGGSLLSFMIQHRKSFFYTQRSRIQEK